MTVIAFILKIMVKFALKFSLNLHQKPGPL